MQYILSIDQGTSSTKTLIFDADGKAIAKGSEPLKSFYMEGGFVEQNPEEIFQNVLLSVAKCLEAFTASGNQITDIKAIGISNQRETFVVWDEAGNPLYNAVVWQCKRSVQVCERLNKKGLNSMINTKTGLVIDPYFSGTKLIWLNENISAISAAIHNGTAFFGTIDTWLLYKMTGGTAYATDYTNASRTLFFNLHTLAWDTELIDLFGLTGINLPEVKPSSADFGTTTLSGLFPFPVAITAMIGDSHAAAFGEGCFTPGIAKATLGTGCSILMNIGNVPKPSKNGMITTICWSTEEIITYALEGVIVSCGATIEWIKNELGIFTDSKNTESMATSVSDNGGVYLIPAFSGLGAPYWNMNRKASIQGLTFNSNKNHIVRAALESIPYQIKDVIVAMEMDADIELEQLMVDGGIASNGFVLQFLADLLKRTIMTIGMADISALGAAYMAGLKSGIYDSIEHLQTLNRNRSIVLPTDNKKINGWYGGWQVLVNSKQN